MSFTALDPHALKAALRDGQELALLDLSEDGQHPLGHLFYAVSAPYSRFETMVARLVPRRSARTVLIDQGDGVAERAARTLARNGYSNVATLAGGTPAWKAAGYVLFQGINVPSKAFGEDVEHAYGTPSIAAEELKARIDRGEDLIVLDSRPFDEFQAHSIPGGICCPGAELAYRVHDLAPSAKTTVVVNCAGRTRSIIGAQSLINAGIANPVTALRNGTMGWRLAGLMPDRGKTARAQAPSETGVARARAAAEAVAQRFKVPRIDRRQFDTWRAEAEQRTLYIFDVRDPAEYAAGHLPGSVSAPGGQLVQATDRWIATLGARIVLTDDTEVRATMTAHWLIQMGWDAHVLAGGIGTSGLENGPGTVDVLGQDDAIEVMTAEDLKRALDQGRTAVIDVGNSQVFRAGHIPGARWTSRAKLGPTLAGLPKGHRVIVSADNDLAAELTARDAEGLTAAPVAMLAGGGAAWVRSGFPLAASLDDPPDDACIDHWFWEHARRRFVPKNMQEYLVWEVELPAQVKEDGDARFRIVVSG
jgi:rhodanese-related sulfurtransferase